jgi:hypothetical protein
MTDLEAKRIDGIVTRLVEETPTLDVHRKEVRAVFAYAVENLAKQDLTAPGALSPDQYLSQIEASLPRKEEEPSDESRGSSLP